jgi:invasion protein IalB
VRRCPTILAAAILAAVAQTGEAGAQNAPAAAPSSRSAASVTQETFEDWSIKCEQREGGPKLCAMTQHQRHRTSNQLVLAMELTRFVQEAVPAGGAQGTLVFPFGLKLADGVSFQIDAGKRSAAVPFSTCVPTGCLVPVSLDAATLGALRNGTALKLTATANDGGKSVDFSISLKGFGPALDRVRTLALAADKPASAARTQSKEKKK